MHRITATLAAVAMLQSVPVMAQPALDGRVNRLEQEMRAVQRKVFPDGAGRTVAPDMTAPAVDPVTGAPASTPVADLTARVSSVEAQMRTLTGQVEENNYKLKQLEKAFADYKAEMAAKAAPEAPATPVPAAGGAKPAASAGTKPTTPAGDAVRKAAVAAVERPDSGNAAEDAYSYGFRLWSAKFYPEAEVQLKATMEKFGTTSVASRTQNLLGRAYLDEGKPALASVAFYENYQKRPQGDRAADSLAYLGEALIQLKKLPDACKVYQELDANYGATLKADLKAMTDKGKVRAKCGA